MIIERIKKDGYEMPAMCWSYIVCNKHGLPFCLVCLIALELYGLIGPVAMIENLPVP